MCVQIFVELLILKKILKLWLFDIMHVGAGMG